MKSVSCLLILEEDGNPEMQFAPAQATQEEMLTLRGKRLEDKYTVNGVIPKDVLLLMLASIIKMEEDSADAS